MTNLFAASSVQNRSRAVVCGFTLIELMLVMTLLTIAVGLTAPALGNFFRGRSLDSEARRLLAMTRHGQGRAISEGIPMDMWFDGANHRIGLEAELSFEPIDERALDFDIDPDMQVEVLLASGKSAATAMTPANGQVNPNIPVSHPGLPRIRFLPEGHATSDSPQMIRLTGRDGLSITLQQNRNGTGYEIAPRN
jgi:prepilin-type N-terminal cleavage/methylation domain-containing protein